MSEPITVEMPTAEGFQRVYIGLDLPQALYDNGAVELYAIKLAGWTPTIINEEGLEVENPITPLQAAALRVRGLVKEEYRGLMANLGSEQGRAAALTGFDAAFESEGE